ncbi:ABC transporter substrate-binding protein [Streptomyces sp. TRM S81-3]|uniref:ABC transporter substrate-binding protein n=1 Tax=Streptomyces griseicoloratus TaxID=2752516 RepID=A0A926L061_9ACTN|nr:ABC transporter substrate-binding protein [Streptomyces griseicoloratus]MBD0420077.1 ABC transporter substrate-binding protein [Streptomyces griseicoloratus]
MSRYQIRFRNACVVGVAAIGLAASGCTADGGGSGAGGSTTLVAYTGQSGDYQINFNPYSPTMIDGPGSIYEPLFFYNVARKDEPKPRLGTEFSWNDKGTELTVTLRQGVKWTDGRPFTADDVVFTFDMVRDNPTMNSTGFTGKTTAVDDTHVKITFDKPSFSEGPQILGKFWIVPKHLWAKIGKPAEDVMKNPVGTGPFKLAEFKPQAFTLEANPDYYDGAPALKKIRYVALSGNQSGADALKAGQIDWQTGPVPDIKNVEKNYPGYRAITVPMNQAALFTCSNADLGCKGPQTDPAVRKAVYYAMDRTQLNALAFENTASEISPGFALPGRDKALVSDRLKDPVAPMQPQPGTARRLLEGAGWTKGSGGIYTKGGRQLALTVKVVAGWTDYITAVNTAAEQLKKAGIKLTVQQLSWNEWSDARGRGQYELLMDSLYQGPAPDPYYLYNYFFSSRTTAPVGRTANPNFARFKDPKVDEALAALAGIAMEDTAARQPYYDTIQTRIEESMPYIPMLTGGTTSEFNARKFTGWPTQDNLYAFPAVWGRPDNSQIYLNLKPAGE